MRGIRYNILVDAVFNTIYGRFEKDERDRSCAAISENTEEFMDHKTEQGICKVVRILTLAPLLALVALTILFFCENQVFSADPADNGLWRYLFTVLFLTVLPLLAYPIQPLVPGFRGKGRDGQRHLAILMAVLGYIGAVIYAFASKAPAGLCVVSLSYLFSGLLVALFNKFFHIKASGHTCGVAGPVTLLVYFCGWWALLGALLFVPVFWASLRMKRHTLPQLCVGAVLSVVSVLIAALIFA